MNTEIRTARPLEELKLSLSQLTRTASPAIAGLAAWVLDHPQEIAFNSVRGLADLAGVNVNTAYRLALSLGYSGFDECRRDFQAALRSNESLYESRAAQISQSTEQGLIAQLKHASKTNLDIALGPENRAKITSASKHLLNSKRIFSIGVRSCFSLAHYFSYTGAMAFSNFEQPFAAPGSIADSLAHAGPDDVAVLITFSLYSMEVVWAHDVCLKQGVRVIAITDAYTSPIAQGAEVVFSLPMNGPQPLPSHGAGFAIVEGIVAEMIHADPAAVERIGTFERALRSIGSYVVP